MSLRVHHLLLLLARTKLQQLGCALMRHRWASRTFLFFSLAYSRCTISFTLSLSLSLSLSARFHAVKSASLLLTVSYHPCFFFLSRGCTRARFAPDRPRILLDQKQQTRETQSRQSSPIYIYIDICTCICVCICICIYTENQLHGSETRRRRRRRGRLSVSQLIRPTSRLPTVLFRAVRSPPIPRARLTVSTVTPLLLLLLLPRLTS